MYPEQVFVGTIPRRDESDIFFLQVAISSNLVNESTQIALTPRQPSYAK